jgi:anti-sigma regulatory factor (Ser/Thr protein kinase)
VSDPRKSQVERSFKRSLDSLREITSFVEGFFEQQRLDQTQLCPVAMAVEELFTNTLKYNSSDHEILIGLERLQHQLAVSVTDYDVERFDINEAPPARVDLPLEARRPGGLGIHLIKQMADRVEYEYVDRRSKTTLFFNTEVKGC